MTAACCDYTPHDPIEPCLFDGCTCCGGTYAFGPSSARECWTCDPGGADLPDGDTDVEEPGGLPALASAWDERPF